MGQLETFQSPRLYSAHDMWGRLRQRLQWQVMAGHNLKPRTFGKDISVACSHAALPRFLTKGDIAACRCKLWPAMCTTRTLVTEMQQIVNWLKKLSMSEYAESAENDIDIAALPDLTD